MQRALHSNLRPDRGSVSPSSFVLCCYLLFLAMGFFYKSCQLLEGICHPQGVKFISYCYLTSYYMLRNVFSMYLLSSLSEVRTLGLGCQSLTKGLAGLHFHL